jgi:hypothetical protein
LSTTSYLVINVALEQAKTTFLLVKPTHGIFGAEICKLVAGIGEEKNGFISRGYFWVFVYL